VGFVVLTASKTIPVTGLGGLLRIPHFLDSRLTDGGEVVIPTHRQLSNPKEHYFLLLLLLVRGKIRKIEKKKNRLIGNRARDLSACSKVPQPNLHSHRHEILKSCEMIGLISNAL
jgi:hypothetical protein